MGLLCPPPAFHPTHNVAGMGGILLIELQQMSSLPTAPSPQSWAFKALTQQGEKGHSSLSMNTMETWHGTSNQTLFRMIASVELSVKKNPRITK